MPNTPVDYLTIGHITKDLIPGGVQAGGTVGYSALTANALGLRAGIVTAWGGDFDENHFSNIQLVNSSQEKTTTFRNIETAEGRIQYLYDKAQELSYEDVPVVWRSPSIVHFGPVANEFDPKMISNFKSSFIGLTPQGWFRTVDPSGRVSVDPLKSPTIDYKNVSAVVLGIEDINNEETFLDDLICSCPVVVVTEGKNGIRLYWNGDVRRFLPPQVDAIDTTGAGDIFAASFFIRLYSTRDPWEAARFATILSAYSTTRRGLDSIPTQTEIKNCYVEVM
jgi:sugar/nucleoside kinase (ribokinase family)